MMTAFANLIAASVFGSKTMFSSPIRSHMSRTQHCDDAYRVQGVEVLTASAPKEASEIEEVMASS